MGTTGVLGIIPARYGSTRFPAKALALIEGKPMVQWVYEQAVQAKGFDDVAVATDHELIADAMRQANIPCLMTKASHPSGTDRCAEAYKMLDPMASYVINIQGDEPFIDPKQIEELIALLHGDTQIATLAKHLKDTELLFSPNTVKVIRNVWGEAMAFSRNPLPYLRNEPNKDEWVEKYTFLKHIGIYAYRTDILDAITLLPQNELELAESLEQLRWLQSGYKIRVGITAMESLSVDTPEDLEKVLAYRKGKSGGY
jgi:3-deoxy-manno-octulosonate cytidylyltransferase (CMP-KDO synthetase)